MQAAVLVLSSHAIPISVVSIASDFAPSLIRTVGWRNFHDIVFLTFSVFLVAHDPRGYGIRVGNIRSHWKLALSVCLVPIALTAIVYPLLPVRPFSGGPIGTWLISPLAQDLFFAGFLYKQSEIQFPGRVGKRYPVERCIFVTAFFFSLWHVPNFLMLDSVYVWFQLLYTFAGACLVGLIRQATDSLMCILFIHMTVNWLAVVL